MDKTIKIKLKKGILLLDLKIWNEIKEFTVDIVQSRTMPNPYARINYKGSRHRTLLHRYILKAKRNQVVDHINGNTLDNRLKNLRFVNNHENSWNTKAGKRNKTGYKGVSWCVVRQLYRATITFKNSYKHIGYFDCKKAAALAYNKMAKKYFGKFAKLNKID